MAETNEEIKAGTDNAPRNKVPRKEVTVEDLLRLKRAERPDVTFWNTFDRELHQRMLQTLVKKDPWYIQLLRGASGRIAQTAAVGAAAVFLAMIVIRPAFVEADKPMQAATMQAANYVQASPQLQDSATPRPLSLPLPNERVERVERGGVSDLDGELTRDYQMEAITVHASADDLGYTPDYSHDSFEVVGYDSSAFATDTASFAGSGLATGLVY